MHFAHLSVPLHPDMQKQKKILFLHGFYASGSCVPALALKAAFEREESELASIPEREQARPKVKEAFEKGGTQRPGESLGGYRATVLTPDLPLHPTDAVKLIRDICDQEKPDILVGNSCGSFYAQMISPIIGVPALLGNPHFKMSDFLRERIGNHQYKSPRADGKQDFTIDEQLISEFEEMEAHQFDCCNIYNKVRVWGLFGEEDTLAHFEPLFLEHYHNTFHFPGGHTPTADQFKTWYVPLIEKLLLEYPISEDRVRYFQHFKGNKYRLEHIAFDSETQERMVVYQALYGDRKYWVRPEKMFFETIERDGKRFSRFTEIDWEE